MRRVRLGAGLVVIGVPALILGPPAAAVPRGTVGAVQRVSAATVNTPIWAGYALAGAKGAFSSVSAAWTQPAVSCAPSQTAYSSYWVGLDGYNSHTVEQVGTEADCVRGTPSYYAWYELYPKFPVRVPLQVASGDHIAASVAYLNGSFTLELTDAADGATPFTVTARSPSARRSSAEVIVEAPSSNHGPFGGLPLADFGQVSFTGASANGSPLESLSPDEVIMQRGSTTLASPEGSLSGGSFTVFWES